MLEAEDYQSCTSDDEEPHGNDEEPHRNNKKHPWEYYDKRNIRILRQTEAVWGHSDDPEESPRHKTLRTENFTAWSMNRDHLLK